ncbi:14584_t:CDS:1, partial [Racocetra fulgida]
HQIIAQIKDCNIQFAWTRETYQHEKPTGAWMTSNLPKNLGAHV